MHMLKKTLVALILISSFYIVALIMIDVRSFTNLAVPFIAEKEEQVSSACEYQQGIEYLYYEDSEWNKNNKFGLYIYAEEANFFEIAQNLANSNGGDWGYVLIPFNVKDRDVAKWERVFEQLRNKHLIPIIQLWDIDTKDYQEQTKDSAKFLDSFVWPIKERYISAYNEPNSADFWYGYIDPVEYAQILDYTIIAFKEVDEAFFVMNGAFNVSASTDNRHQDSFVYIRKMNEAFPGIFERLDGWASHSYPQPNFSGDPDNTGRYSIRAYEEELEFLHEELGVEKELPVFITETGWAHAEGEGYNATYYGLDTVADYFETAYEDVWLEDDRVRAVTPFTIKYAEPFDHFSWVNKDDVPYKQYETIKDMKKEAGNPPSIKVGTIGIECPQETPQQKQ